MKAGLDEAALLAKTLRRREELLSTLRKTRGDRFPPINSVIISVIIFFIFLSLISLTKDWMFFALIVILVYVGHLVRIVNKRIDTLIDLLGEDELRKNDPEIKKMSKLVLQSTPTRGHAGPVQVQA